MGRFINRGFLIGPWCPIYGFGTVLITLLLSKFTDDPLAVFALAMLLCGTLEYLTSYIMEKAFHARWWDYSTKKFNLNGRVCADTLIPFGLLGLGMIYFIKPFSFRLYGLMSETAMQAICIALLIPFLTDTVISSFTLLLPSPSCRLFGRRQHRSHHPCGTQRTLRPARPDLAHPAGVPGCQHL